MSILVFIEDLVIATFSQMATLFAGIFIFGLLIHFISSLTFKSIYKAFWNKGTYFFAWLGTPIHELGHALFCVIFAHKIVEIQLFKPDPVTGTLGYVTHRWNRWNPWQVLGNVFIGTGPVILGCGVLFAIFYFLIPNSSQAWESILLGINGIDDVHSIGSYLTAFAGSASTMVLTVFTVSNLTGWRFWVFCYLSICVASNMRLSLQDIKGSLPGIGMLIMPFLLINFLGMVTGLGGERFLPLTASSLGVVYSLLMLALMMDVIGFILSYAISAIYVKITRGYMLSPF